MLNMHLLSSSLTPRLHHYLLLFICFEIPKLQVFIEWSLFISASFLFVQLSNPSPCQDRVRLCSLLVRLWFHVLTLSSVIQLEFIFVYVVRQGSLHVYFCLNSLSSPAPFTTQSTPFPAVLTQATLSHAKFFRHTHTRAHDILIWICSFPGSCCIRLPWPGPVALF